MGQVERALALLSLDVNLLALLSDERDIDGPGNVALGDKGAISLAWVSCSFTGVEGKWGYQNTSTWKWYFFKFETLRYNITDTV